MFAYILLLLALLYLLQFLVCTIAAFAARYRTQPGQFPTVDIIIAARNEEQRIEACLSSIALLTYPKDLLTVVVVDDRSTDGTASIIRRFSEKHPWIRLMTAVPSRDHLQGKANAITQAIEATRGEIILMTDADCEVPPQWVESIVQYYSEEKVGVVAGFTSLGGRSLFERMQALDWLVLFSVASAVIRVGLPVTAVGTNLSVRRRAYNAVGGYRSIPFSVTEDYALFHAITSRRDFVARFPRDARTLVRSYACPTWRDLHRQKKRWFAGGKGMDATRLLLFAPTYLFHALLLVGLFVSPAAVVVPLCMKLAADILLTLSPLSAFRRWDTLAAFPLYEAYQFYYVLTYPLLVAITDDVVWKERSFGGEAQAKTIV